MINNKSLKLSIVKSIIILSLITIIVTTILFPQDRSYSQDINIEETTPTPISTNSSGIESITLDPGHGGKDKGNKGPENIYEKDITLDIGLKVEKLVSRNLGLRVILTRNIDRAIETPQRIALANNNKTDLFISLHANSDSCSYTKGLTLYIQKTHRFIHYDDNVFQENNGKLSDYEAILFDMMVTKNTNQSEKLAQILYGFFKKEGLSIRETEHIDSVILDGTIMPSIIIDIGFMSNFQEGNMLTENGYRQKIAEVIYKSISEYKRVIIENIE
ncbi:MAG: N-acetylmuramoyl-L-alanine amidase [bacterium]